MAGSITLNKASGGQLTLTPEDGTSTEAVTIPSAGVGKVLRTGTLHSDQELATSTINTWLTACTFTIPSCTAGNKLNLNLSFNTLLEQTSFKYYRILYNGAEVGVSGTYTASNGNWRGIPADIHTEIAVASTGNVVLTFQCYTTADAVYNNYGTTSSPVAYDGTRYIRTNLSWMEVAA